MKQVVQSTGKGTLSVLDVPAPDAGPTDVLVETTRSLVSSGTERALRELAQSSLLKKAQKRPDLVKQVLNRVKSDGLRKTFTAVRDKLDAVTPLGYSAAGVVVACGEHAPLLAPGTRVATASVGHAEMQVVPGLLAVPVPDAVTDEEAAFGAVAAIAMHGLHQSGLMLGDTVVVAGLGLVGQLTARLAVAAGLKVIGIDPQAGVVALAEQHGALAIVESGDATTQAIRDLTGGRLADAVVITASTASSEPVMRGVERVRERGRVIVVGDVGLDIDRTPFYVKEVDLRFARSYGPGRYDPRFEAQALDYPVGYVPRTQRTNIAAYLDLVARRRLQVSDLVSKTFPIADAVDAYETLSTNRDILAIQFTYDRETDRAKTVKVGAGARTPGGVALIGTGDFVGSTLLPAMQSTGWGQINVVASSGGLSATALAKRAGIPEVSSDADAVIARDDVDTVFIATRHDSHARLAVQGLTAGKNVYCEKPLAIDEAEFDEVVEALGENPGLLWLGFNRRYSEMVTHAKSLLGQGTTPMTVHYRVSAGALPDTHWLKDPRQGGRLLGEVCHFVDTSTWLIGAEPVSVTALGRSDASTVLQEDVTLMVGYANGATSTIEYITDAHSSTPKERIEIMGRGHTVIIDDFKTMTCDGEAVTGVGTGKGHADGLRTFREQLRATNRDPRHLQVSLSTAQTMIAAIASLADGRRVDVEPVKLA